MAARSGTEHHHSGPHLLGPKADEEPITRSSGGCFGCGDKYGVMEFGLVRRGRPAGTWRLCSACYEWGVGDRAGLDPDPLAVPT